MHPYASESICVCRPAIKHNFERSSTNTLLKPWHWENAFQKSGGSVRMSTTHSYSCPEINYSPGVVVGEVNSSSRLLRLDDAAADGAGAGEEILQLVALAPADVALEGGEVLAEAAEHLQHGLAVIEEDVAPHDRVGGGDAREIAEAAGGEFDH